jgi:hypothetical protein
MKTPLICIAAVCLRVNVMAQGVIIFVNDPRDAVTNFCLGQPVPAGTIFFAELYYAPDGVTNETALLPFGARTTFGQPGIFRGRGIRLPNTPQGSAAMLQVKVWEAAYGTNYEEAVAAQPLHGRRAITGKSAVFRQPTWPPGADPPDPTPLWPFMPAFTVGLPECAAVGAVWFESDPAVLVTNLCTAEPLLAGTNFLAALYYAPDGTLDETLYLPVGSASRIGPRPGHIDGGVRVVPATTPGELISFQVRVWESAFGATYEDAQAAPMQNGRRALLGRSPIIRSPTSSNGSPLPSLAASGLGGFYVGNLDCTPPGAIVFHNAPTSLVTNLCTAEAVRPGTNFLAALYYAPVGTSGESFFLRLGDPVSFGQEAGRFSGGLRITPPGTRPGELGLFQVRVWEAAFGATYEDALAAPPRDGRVALVGESAILPMRTLGDNPWFGPAPTLVENGLQGFYIGKTVCRPPGSILFQNSSTTLVMDRCTGEAVSPNGPFVAALYSASDGVTNELEFAALGEPVAFGPEPGRFYGGPRVVPGTTGAGEAALFQVRAWDITFGATYEEATVAPPRDGRRASAGKSAVFRMRTLETGAAPTPPPLPALHGLNTFIVGEPLHAVLFENDHVSLVGNLCTRGPALAGTTFLAALYYAPDGTADESVFRQIGEATGFGPEPGQFHAGLRTIPETWLPGRAAMFQIRVWESAFGATYEQALSSPPRHERTALVGKSEIVRVTTLGECRSVVPPPTLTQFGLKGFNVGYEQCRERRVEFSPSITNHLGFGGSSMATGDFNGDGRLDLVIVTYGDPDSWISLVFGDGNGGFGAPVSRVAQGLRYGVATGDFNHDGNIDLAVTHFGGFSLFLGNGRGGFTERKDLWVHLGGFTYELAVGDFSGDGNLDVVVTDYFEGRWYMNLGNGDGTFQAPIIQYQDFLPLRLAAAHLNGDCLMDLVVAHLNTCTIRLLTSNEGQNFETFSCFNAPASDVAVADFNHDHQADIVAADTFNSVVRLFLGTYQREFVYVGDFMAGYWPAAVVIGDYNGDGLPDMAVLDNYYQNIHVFLNQTTQPRVTDDAVSTVEDTPVLIPVIENDSREGTSFRISAITQPTHGTAWILDETNVLYQPDANFFGTDSFVYRVSGCQENAEVANVVVTVLPVNDPPVAVVHLLSPTSLQTNGATLLALVPDNWRAKVILDATRSSDIEGDFLQFSWLDRETGNVLGVGARLTNLLARGSHEILLKVFDGTDTAEVLVRVEVLTPCDAIGRMTAAIETTRVLGKQGLMASLEAACAAFERSNVAAGVQQLEAFRKKLTPHLLAADPVLANRLATRAAQIIDILREIGLEKRKAEGP